MNDDDSNINTEMQYCCMLCMETSINKETGAKMCRNCQKPICSVCFHKLQKKQQYIYIYISLTLSFLYRQCPWCNDIFKYIKVNIESMNHTMSNLLLASTRTEFSCTEHYGNELLFWCKTCESLICKICVGSTHRQHGIDKHTGEKILKLYSQYKTKRYDFLHSEFTKLFKQKIENINPICDNYFTKLQNESKSVIKNSLTTFTNDIKKQHSHIQSKQDSLIKKIRELKDKITKTANDKGKYTISHEEVEKIKNEIQNIKENIFYSIKDIKDITVENYITPNTICVPLEFNVKYPLNLNSNFKASLKRNNGYAVMFKVSFENTNKNNVINFEIKIVDLKQPLPVVWGISVFSKSKKERNYFNRKFTFNAKSSIYDTSKKLSIVIAENLEACDDILLTEGNAPNMAIIKINVYLRYLTYTSIKEF